MAKHSTEKIRKKAESRIAKKRRAMKARRTKRRVASGMKWVGKSAMAAAKGTGISIGKALKDAGSGARSRMLIRSNLKENVETDTKNYVNAVEIKAKEILKNADDKMSSDEIYRKAKEELDKEHKVYVEDWISDTKTRKTELAYIPNECFEIAYEEAAQAGTVTGRNKDDKKIIENRKNIALEIIETAHRMNTIDDSMIGGGTALADEFKERIDETIVKLDNVSPSVATEEPTTKKEKEVKIDEEVKKNYGCAEGEDCPEAEKVAKCNKFFDNFRKQMKQLKSPLTTSGSVHARVIEASKDSEELPLVKVALDALENDEKIVEANDGFLEDFKTKSISRLNETTNVEDIFKINNDINSELTKSKNYFVKSITDVEKKKQGEANYKNVKTKIKEVFDTKSNDLQAEADRIKKLQKDAAAAAAAEAKAAASETKKKLKQEAAEAKAAAAEAKAAAAETKKKLKQEAAAAEAKAAAAETKKKKEAEATAREKAAAKKAAAESKKKAEPEAAAPQTGGRKHKKTRRQRKNKKKRRTRNQRVKNMKKLKRRTRQKKLKSNKRKRRTRRRR